VRRKGIVKPLNRIGLIIALLAVLLPVAACSKDPEVAKRDTARATGTWDNKLAEAIDKNAVQIMRGSARRFKLGGDVKLTRNRRDRWSSRPTFSVRDYIGRQSCCRNATTCSSRSRSFSPGSSGADAQRIAGTLVKKPQNTDALIVQAQSMARLKTRSLPSGHADRRRVTRRA
jgi:hypothetical protein